MWTLRTVMHSVLHSIVMLGVVVAAGQLIGVLLATPAAACFGFRCFQFHALPQFHAGPQLHAPMSRPYFGRRTMTPLTSSLAAPRAASVNLHQHPLPSAGSQSSGSQIKSDGKKCPGCRMRNPGANAPNPTGQGGTDAAAFSPNGQSRGFGPSGTSPSSLGAAGGAGAGPFNAGSDTSGSGTTGSGNASGGTAAGQFNAATGPGSSATTGSANPAATGGAAKRSTSGSTAGSTGTTPTNTTLTAVTACVTQVGSCPMQRDLGTVCQCQDTQGRVYDGIVK